MSEYQYYEFQAVDRPLTMGEQQALRQLSTRARITPSRFVNSYEWGDFKGNPARLMETYFDLHLYFANWGTRRFSLRLPARLLDVKRLDAMAIWTESAACRTVKGYVIVDIERNEIEDSWDLDEAHLLARLAPLRADVLSGDLRLFYLIWLMGVETDEIEDDASEPLPGLAPLSDAHRTFAEFFGMDTDLVEAAAAGGAAPNAGKPGRGEAEAAIRALSEDERVEFLLRLSEGDPHVAVELLARIRAQRSETMAPRLRTAGEIKQTMSLIAAEKQRVAAEKATAEREQQAAEAARARQVRLDFVRRRGERVWHDVDSEITRGNAKSYMLAANLLADLRDIAEAAGNSSDFSQRLAAIKLRYGGRWRFMEQLDKQGLA